MTASEAEQFHKERIEKNGYWMLKEEPPFPEEEGKEDNGQKIESSSTITTATNKANELEGAD